MDDNDELIQHMFARGFLKSETIANAFAKIDRRNFVRNAGESQVYGDYPLEIGRGQTISQPSTVAFMLEKLDPHSGDKILDIGSGSGWTTALLAELVGSNGKVFGVEKIPELVRFGQNNLAKYEFNNASIQKSTDRLGLPDKAPFDRILVSAEADSVPIELVDQLKAGAVMVIPVRDSIYVIYKDGSGNLSEEIHRGFRFVPLV